MVYQTLPLCFPFNPSSATANSSPSHLFTLSTSSSQVKSEMEYVEARALKASLRPEMAMKSNQQVFFDDGCGGLGQNSVSCDDFVVDDLLDFSNEDVEEGIAEEEEEEKGCVSISSQQKVENDYSNSSNFSVTELSVPADDLADLEWLSHFVEDSFSEFSLPCLAGCLTEKTQNENQNGFAPETGTASNKTPSFPKLVPSKARSKRSRTVGRLWSPGSLSLTESSSSSSSSSSSASSNSCLIFANTGQNLDLFYCLGKPPAKKHKKKSSTDSGGTQPQRRCSHCHVQKTPQWRTGPLGAKTLCNACGVRYKSGRLLPEYRPACSPTFSSDVHSNNHRKVLEMRRKKEKGLPESGFAPAVQSF